MNENDGSSETSMSNETAKISQLRAATSEREDLEKTLEDAKGELAEIRKARSDALVKYINEDPVRFVKLVCQGFLGIDTDERNPFAVKLEDQPDIAKHRFTVSRKMFGGFAHLMLDKIASRNGEAAPEVNSEFTPFSEIVRDWFSGEFKWIQGNEFQECNDLESVLYVLFERFNSELGSALDTAAYQIFEGVPIYRKEDDGFKRLPIDDPLHIYIFKKGEFWETGRITSIPEWVDGLYVKKSDLDAHDAYFSGSGEMTPEGLALRRQALRNTLGVDTTVETSVKDSDIAGLTEQIDQLKAELAKANARVTSLEKDVLSGKSKATALRLIGGLAMVGAELDIHGAKIEGITDVMRDLALKGVSVSEDTLRTYLQEAAATIGKAGA